MNTSQAYHDVESLRITAEAQRDAPTLGVDAHRVLESVGSRDRPTTNTDDLVTELQSASKGVGCLEDIVDRHVSLGIGSDRGTQRGMVDDPAAMEVSQEVLDLIDRNGVGDSDVDASAFFKRRPAVDADQPPCGIEQRPTRVARVDRGIRLNAIGLFQ